MRRKQSQSARSLSRSRRSLIFFLGYLAIESVFKKFSQAFSQQLPSNPIVDDTKPEIPSNPTLTPQPVSPTQPPQAVVNQQIEFLQKTVNGVLLYQTIINLQDPEQLLTIGLANQAPQANSNIVSYGDEEFAEIVKRYQGAITVSGTFFSKDEEKRVMGNMVAGGKFLKYSQWENYGTTLGIKAGNQLEMITARLETQPKWEEHWFSLTCGPRLLKNGEVWLYPEEEGFQDPHVFDEGWRSAIGFLSSGNVIYLVTFQAILSLEKEAELMKAIGCSEAMNLDGGASRALAHRGKIIIPAGRNLTNVIVGYDRLNPAPEYLKDSWRRFQQAKKAIFK
jgi:exopolysaccharide biosynthesis protein